MDTTRDGSSLETAMTEQEWFLEPDPQGLLEYIAPRLSHRKLRLIAVACCRMLGDLLTEVEKNGLTVGEQEADGLAGNRELREACLAIMQQSGSLEKGWQARSVQTALYSEANKDLYLTPEKFTTFPLWIPYSKIALAAPEDFVLFACIKVSGVIAEAAGVNESTERSEPLLRQVFAEQATICREIIGNPFRPVSLPAKPPPALRQIAQAVYSGSVSVATLDTALVGYGLNQLAEHFRSGTHPKGCWALDLLLGKE
jgi:hypothetical protein